MTKAPRKDKSNGGIRRRDVLVSSGISGSRPVL